MKNAAAPSREDVEDWLGGFVDDGIIQGFEIEAYDVASADLRYRLTGMPVIESVNLMRFADRIVRK